MGDLLPARKIFIERPANICRFFLYNTVSFTTFPNTLYFTTDRRTYGYEL